MKSAVVKRMFLVLGKADALIGRHISLRDFEQEFLSGMDTILSDKLYTLEVLK
tara:strand:- start:426 stop:584 length:159 start_codon:yes stop_codon:yes gene_type:complete